MPTKFVNALILTQNPLHPVASTMVVEGGHVLALGEAHQLNPSGARCVDLGGRTVLPGFNDAHVHTWKVGHLLTSMLDVRGVGSLGELQARLAAAASRLPAGKWLIARGYNEAVLAEGRHPTRHDLDAAAPGRPVYLIRTCAHIAVASTTALELAGVGSDTAPPPGGEIARESDGRPEGRLHETALGLITRAIPPMTVADYQETIVAGARHQLARGITSATDPAVTPELIAAYRGLDDLGRLPNRHNLLAIRRPDGGSETLPLPERHLTERLRIDSVKFFADGGLSGATAAMKSPYRHADTRGVLRFDDEELYILAREAHVAGLRIGTHAIGDAAIEQVLAVYTRLAGECPGPRHRIEHLGLPEPHHLQRMRHLGTIAVSQPVFLHDLGGNFRRYLHDHMLARTYPYRDMIEAGVTLAFSSDAPVVRDDNPMLGLRAALLRQSAQGDLIAPGQGVTLAEAISAYTLGGAIASGDEANRGTLDPGKWADFVVLSGDPFLVDPSDLLSVQVEETWLAGECVYRR